MTVTPLPVRPRSRTITADRTVSADRTVTIALDITLRTQGEDTEPLLRLIRQLVDQGGGRVTVTGAPDRRYERAEQPTAPEDDTERARRPSVRIDAAARQVLVDGVEVALTRLEFDLLHFLAAHPRRVFSREHLLRSVWGYAHAGPRTVDVHVRRLRGKIGEETPLVTTVYGIGYRLDDEADALITRDAVTAAAS